MEVIGIRINQSSISNAAHVNGILIFVLRSPSEPYTIKIDVISGAGGNGNVLKIDSRARGSGNFESKKTVVVRTASQDNRAAYVASRFRDDCENVLSPIAVECRPSRKRGDAAITRLHSRSFRGQTAVWSVGPHDDPVLVIARLCRQGELAGEGRPCRQFNGVPAVGAVQGRLQVTARAHLNS